MVETASFMWHKEGVHLTLYETDDLRLQPKGPERRLANADTIRLLIEGQAALSAFWRRTSVCSVSWDRSLLDETEAAVAQRLRTAKSLRGPL